MSIKQPSESCHVLGTLHFGYLQEGCLLRLEKVCLNSTIPQPGESQRHFDQLLVGVARAAARMANPRVMEIWSASAENIWVFLYTVEGYNPQITWARSWESGQSLTPAYSSQAAQAWILTSLIHSHCHPTFTWCKFKL